MAELDSSFNSNDFNFIDMILTSSFSEKNKLIYIDSSKEKTKIKYFKFELPSYGKTHFHFYYNGLVKEKLDIYGPDSLFMRMNSYISDFVVHDIYVYGLKGEYYLYKKNFVEILIFINL